MRAVIQRVFSASVTVDGTVIGEIGRGLVILLGVERTDSESEAKWLARKVASLRVFGDADGKMNLALTDIASLLSGAGADLPQALVVSQFTLIADTRKGSRPSFNDAARPDIAKPLYAQFIKQLEAVLGKSVATGRFGADMKLALLNDGPLTLVVESPSGKTPCS